MENKTTAIRQNIPMDNYVKTDNILNDMCGIIETSRDIAYQAVNSVLLQRNWLIGYRIAEEGFQGDGQSQIWRGYYCQTC